MDRKEITLQSRLRCPSCGFEKEEQMPTNACQYFYSCNSCGEQLKPLKGDCCVFCSYGSVPCPPIQENGGGGNCCSA
ncbi:GDCCVxC domain-containing (seleno)protein [Nafulsella turpanensis]|uniref:GDCCVxC domain-containing (seleno)protein n=1 Tax=Nafulsella turpanensis TaxID=1265690 RepID=UPI0003449CB6|nr:GDCCVxC domain-containing (seleno)protein [Nafulsella turpanensis]